MSDSGSDFETLAQRPVGPSLKARAIGFLSRREHSRRELARKLAPHAPDNETLQSLLDDLARENWQSDERFAHSLVNRRAERQGLQRIAQELHQHGIDAGIISAIESQLHGTEAERARDVWDRKFGSRPTDAKGYAKQYRFMISRGFSADCVRRIIGDLPT